MVARYQNADGEIRESASSRTWSKRAGAEATASRLRGRGLSAYVHEATCG